ncbi:hypothetical protein V5F80_00945 [Xanthobacter sp. VTT E-85239]|uniref:hypothetical protein n=1 Tax=Xanthobacter sp. VTT E-85239 TaxID=3119919 RepID=UPI0037295EAD
MPQEIAIGKNGQLFLIGGNHSVLEYISGEKQILEGAKRIFRNNIRARAEYCTQRGMNYAHFVCPDKHTILFDDFPFEIKVNVSKIFDDFCEGDVVLPTAELRKVQELEGAYMRTDTHWSALGQLEVVRQVINRLDWQIPTAKKKLDAIRNALIIQKDYIGDLGNKLNPKDKEDRLIYPLPSHIFKFNNGVTGNNGTITAYINPEATGKLMVFGDSFIISCMDMISSFFGESIVVRTPFFHREMVDQFKPDAVLTANVERYLPNMPLDDDAPIATLFAQILDREFRPDPYHFEVLSALLRPDSNHKERTLKRVFAALEEKKTAAAMA